MQNMFEKIGKLGIPLFILMPVAGFMVALFDIRSKSSALVYVFFAMVFGYAISFEATSADSFRYAEAFARFDSELNSYSLLQMYRDGELRDIYRVFVFYIVSLFSNNPKVMFAFAGMVYGVFSYKSLCVFVRERGYNWDLYIVALTTIFYTYISLSGINGFRFNTGALVLFYATYKYFIEKSRIWIVVIIITPVFHYGFILLIPILLLFRLLHPLTYNHSRTHSSLLYLFMMAFFTSWFIGTNSISLGFISEISPLSGAIGNRVDYLNSDKITDLVSTRKDSSLFLGVQEYFHSAIKIYVFISILYLYKLLKNLDVVNKLEYTRLFSFVLLLLSFSFILISFPSGMRFMKIALLFFVLYLGKYYGIDRSSGMRKIIIIALPVFAFNIAFINLMLPYLIVSPTMWYGNIFWLIIEGLV